MMKKDGGKTRALKWRLSKRFALSLAVILPMSLFWGIKQMASWRPQRLAVGTTTQAGGPTTAHLGDLKSASNDRLLFLSNSGDFSSDGPLLTEGGSFFRVLNINGQMAQTRVSALYGNAVVHFLSDTKAVIWGVNWDYSDEVAHAKVVGQIFDCQTMRPLKQLQEGELTLEGNYKYGSTHTRSGNPVLVTEFEAMEWSLSSGRLLHHWKFKKPGDDQYLTHTIYSPRTNIFVQTMAAHIRVWDAKTGKLTHTSANALPNFKLDYGEGDLPSDVEFSPDGDVLAYDTVLPNGSEGPLNIARCDTGQILWQIQDLNEAGWPHFTPDDREVYFNSRDKRRFTVRDVRTGRILRYLQSPADVDRFWIAPDGNHLCSDCAGTIWWQRLH